MDHAFQDDPFQESLIEIRDAGATPPRGGIGVPPVMVQTPQQKTVGWLTRWASGLRFPTLLAVIGSLFLLDLLIPDLIPFVDEMLLGLFTVLLAMVRRKSTGSVPETAGEKTIDVEPVKDRADTRQPGR